MNTESSFSDILLHELQRHRSQHHSDNFDPQLPGSCSESTLPSLSWIYADLKKIKSDLFGSRKLPAESLKQAKVHIQELVTNTFNPDKILRKRAEGYNFAKFLYDHLEDEESKRLLLNLLAYRILGHEKVRLLRNKPEYWDQISKMGEFVEEEKSLQVGERVYLSKINLNSFAENLKLYTMPKSAAYLFLQGMYRYEKSGVECKVAPGDIVIDAGGCWGDTAVYFANEAGRDGKVYTIEFIPSNISAIKRNLEMNPGLSERIKVVQNPLWENSSTEMFYLDRGPASRVSFEASGPEYQKCTTISIDDLVARDNLKSVDFIKMDIEGAELAALKGATKTLKTFAPKLAISLYHRGMDLIEIPEFLNSLGVGYKFYLDHHTTHYFETVLYATARARSH